MPTLKWLERVSPRLNTLWRGEWRTGFIEPARYLYDHELVCVSKGTCRVQFEDRVEELDEGMFLIIPPAKLHVGTPVSRRVFRSCIHFDWVTAKTMPSHPFCSYHPKRPKMAHVVRTPDFVPKQCFVGRFPMDGAIPALLETLFLQWQTGEAFHQARCRGVFLELLMHLLWPKTEKSRLGDRGIQWAHAAKDALDRQEENDGSIQALLAGLGGSYSHICRLFHQHFNLTPGEYLTARKLERAKELLRDSRLSIAEIAYKVGFHDAGYFTRKFRQRNGIPPKQFRQ
ncbi:MAG: AraC family transcriptional regulator [Chthoniobacteraceae bacterium]